MKTKTFISQLMILLILTFLIFACNKDDDENEQTDPNTGTLLDIDGNSYTIVKIGEQWWMGENLKTTTFRNDENIPEIGGSGDWTSTQTAAYCNSGNDPDKAAIYGRLYNYYAATDGRKICPDGWHVPTNEEWETLMIFLGGNEVAGGKLKQSGTEYWNSPNAEATNESGFSALPGGVRNANTGNFEGIGSNGSWWSTTQQSGENALIWGVTFVNGSISNYGIDKNTGLSVRCIKD
ncbi:MAG: fibrobacter succinogenes major paralogous domain-containing protein [Bacteroidales bacterium]